MHSFDLAPIMAPPMTVDMCQQQSKRIIDEIVLSDSQGRIDSHNVPKIFDSLECDDEIIVVDDLPPLSFAQSMILTPDPHLNDEPAKHYFSLQNSKGKKERKNRVFGGSVCDVCNESFLNDARLKRHRMIHEVRRILD